MLSRKLTVEGDFSRIVFLKMSVHETKLNLWLSISAHLFPKRLKISRVHFMFIIDVPLSYF